MVMSEVTEERMDHMETTLNEIKEQVTEISRGLFGDDKFDQAGIVDRITILEKNVRTMQGVSDRQQISISAKKILTDDAILWLQRIFWLVAVMLGIGLVLTGKIGFADLFK